MCQQDINQELHLSWSGNTLSLGEYIQDTKNPPFLREYNQEQEQPPTTRPNPHTLKTTLFFKGYTIGLVDQLILSHLDKKTHKFHDHYRWIISSILFARMTDRRINSQSFVNLHFDHLIKVISRKKTKQFLTELQQWGLIHSDRKWIPGRKSIGYRIAPEHAHQPIRQITLSDTKMNTKIKHFHDYAEEHIRGRKGYASCLYWLKELQVEQDEALTYINATCSPDGDDYTAKMMSINMIATKQYFATVDTTAGRMHTNLSNLSSDLRGFLRINGQPLHQVDIVNSQPLLLHLTIRDMTAIDATERAQMERLVTSGGFYEAFNADGQERGQFKKTFFQYLYGRNQHETPTSLLFASKFPSYDRAIREMKKGDHARLAIAMQREEAKLIYLTAAKFATATRHQAPILTIHDSLVTTTEHLALAKHILEQTFNDSYGVTPATTTK